MLHLKQLPEAEYSAHSRFALARYCLSTKQHHVRDTRGIGHASCCACIACEIGGRTMYFFGNSRLQNPVVAGIYRHPYMRCHGEASAIMRALERCDDLLRANGGNIRDLIHRIYVELSPCDRCMPLLEDLNPDLRVFYSWEYPHQIPAWHAAARALCRG